MKPKTITQEEALNMTLGALLEHFQGVDFKESTLGACVKGPHGNIVRDLGEWELTFKRIRPGIPEDKLRIR